MTRKELNLSIFQGTADKVLWQPRIEMWMVHHRNKGTLPGNFSELTNMEIYDALGCSIRYPQDWDATFTEVMQYYATIVDTFEKRLDERHTESIVRTKKGDLRTIYQTVTDIEGHVENKRIVEFPVKNVKDLKILTYLIENQRFVAIPEVYKEITDRVGQRAEPTKFLPSSGFTDLIKFQSGLLNTFYMLKDNTSAVEEYLEACDGRDMRIIEEVLKLPYRIFNLGDHATNEFTPPPILKKYILPRWKKISRIMTENERFVHSHWDGNARLILPYLQESGLHGVEALTPAPMCDMTLEEIKQAVGDTMVALDLIPVIFFLPSYPMKDLLAFVEKVTDMFAPRLILGVSDELSSAGEIERIEAISELIDKKYGLAK